MTTATLTAEPTARIGLRCAAEALGVPRQLLGRNLATWADVLEQPEVTGRGHGSGTRRYWTPRDLVVMAMLIDTMGNGQQVLLNMDLRAELARAIYEAPWGWGVVVAAAGPLEVVYRPRWDISEPAEVVA